LATLPLVLVLPILCLFALAVRLAMQRRLPRFQLAWAHWTNSLLIASGLLSTLFFSMAYFVGPRPAWQSSPMPVMEYSGAFPRLPASETLSAARLAKETEALVFVISPEFSGVQTPRRFDEAGAVGAGVLLQATSAGFLIATNRHVVDASSFLMPRRAEEAALLFRKDGAATRGNVVARHRDLDLALVWTPRNGDGDAFRQPIAPFSEAEIGQNVFVIGHPQRLFFSLSTGIVMRLQEQNLLQISAPVSPGNSGGPVYDERGRLLGVVSFKVDRRFNPNAENLNFAVRADALLQRDGWDFQGDGERILGAFWDGVTDGVSSTGATPGAAIQPANPQPMDR
jgi:S1-C subfamily serine protease